MEVHVPIRSSHLYDLLRYEEQRHQVPIIYGKRPHTSAIGAFIVPQNGTDSNDKPISISLDECELVVGYEDVDTVILAHDLDAILTGDKNPPEEMYHHFGRTATTGAREQNLSTHCLGCVDR